MTSRSGTNNTISCMRSPIRTVALLGAMTMLASPAAGQAPKMIIMPGIVRDFQRAHTDFDIIPSGGYGHYAGNIAWALGADQNPVYGGAGFRVGTEWTNMLGRNIAPIMFMSSRVVPLGNAPVLDLGAFSDTWDSSVGPFIAQVPGPGPTYSIGGPMPNVSAPSPFVINVGDVSWNMAGNGTPANVISADIHCNNFTSEGAKNTDPIGTVLEIQGDVTILVEGDFILSKKGYVNIPAGSSLTLYVRGLFQVSQESAMNMPPEDPYRLRVINLGTTQMEINQTSAVSAIITSPDAPLHLAQGDQFFGKFIGSGLHQDQLSGFHWDTSPIRDQCNAIIEDIEGVAGLAKTGGITSAATYAQWYTDVLGVNLSQIYLLQMARDVTGVYTTSLPEFHPIDDRLYGNEGDAHNYFFTYEFNAEFVYDACTNQFFQFSGADDVWVYIDGRLVIDLGGVLPGADQVIELDRLGLTDGQSYTMKFFYAQRQMVDTSFNLQTNAVLLPPVLTASGTAGFD